jgi:hypothetical protein
MSSYYRQHRQELFQQTLDQCAEVMIRARTPKIFSHVVALKLCGIGLPPGIPETDSLLDVCVGKKAERSQMEGIRFYYWPKRFQPWCINSRFNVWCSHPLDVWLQMSASLDVDRLVVLAESMIRDSHIKFSAFNSRLLDGRPFHGCGRCERALKLIRKGADSPAETQLRLQLVNHGLPEPEINYAVPDVLWDAGFPIKFDLGYVKQKVLIEYDGSHHGEDEQRYIDNDKRSFIESLGWRILVIDSEGMKNIDEICRRISRLVMK